MRHAQDIDDLNLRDDDAIARMAGVCERTVRRYHRAEVRGVASMAEGPALVVGNHNAGLWSADSFIFAAAAYRAHGLAGVPYGLGHEIILRVPVLGPALTALGAVRASHSNAERLFELGHKVLVYPGGDYDSMRPFRHRDHIVFGGRRGYVRLAIRAGVPIIPLVSAGAHATNIVVDDLRWLPRLLGLDRRFRLKVLPLTLSFPLGLTIWPLVPHVPFPTRMLIEALPAIHFERSGEAAAADAAYVWACAAEVEAQMQRALIRLADVLRSS